MVRSQGRKVSRSAGLACALIVIDIGQLAGQAYGFRPTRANAAGQQCRGLRPATLTETAVNRAPWARGTKYKNSAPCLDTV